MRRRDSLQEMGPSGEAEGVRTAMGGSAAVTAARIPDPAVDAKPKRRRFTAGSEIGLLNADLTV